MYEDLIAPIAHLGAEDHVTATQLRNVLSGVAAKLECCDPVERIDPEALSPEPDEPSVLASEPDTHSPVGDELAPEAIDEIGRMRSKEKLQSIIDSDERVTVQEAARKRLAELVPEPTDGE